jgi:hypothetical protein
VLFLGSAMKRVARWIVFQVGDRVTARLDGSRPDIAGVVVPGVVTQVLGPGRYLVTLDFSLNGVQQVQRTEDRLSRR